MPTYDYVCDACDHAFELRQSMTDPVKRKCPKCAKQKLRRLIGAGAAVMFKGSGFYTTDYRSEGYKKKAADDKASRTSDTSSSSSTESKSGGESKADSKPETKKEAKSESTGSAKSGEKKK